MVSIFEFKEIEVVVTYEYDEGTPIKYNNIEDAPEPPFLEINEVCINAAVYVNITTFLQIKEWREELERKLLEELKNEE